MIGVSNYCPRHIEETEAAANEGGSASPLCHSWNLLVLTFSIMISENGVRRNDSAALIKAAGMSLPEVNQIELHCWWQQAKQKHAAVK